MMLMTAPLKLQAAILTESDACVDFRPKVFNGIIAVCCRASDLLALWGRSNSGLAIDMADNKCMKDMDASVCMQNF